MTNKPILDNDPPTHPPKHNPLTADDYAAIQKVIERGQLLEDAIQRAHHIGLDVGQHAATHERDQAIAKRLLAMYPQVKHPLEE